jgi:hypothetical protein
MVIETVKSWNAKLDLSTISHRNGSRKLKKEERSENGERTIKNE